MPLTRTNPTSTNSWQALQRRADSSKAFSLMKAFESTPDRAAKMSLRDRGIFLDYSKNLIAPEELELLIQLAKECGLRENRDAMMSGERINETENRAVLHSALRTTRKDSILVDNENVLPAVQEVLKQMRDFVAQLHDGFWKGHTGAQIKHVVNIGIGGSDLGPVMVYEALTPYHKEIQVHFISNIDGAHLEDTLANLDPRTTLFVIASKSFTTIETMTNAHSARRWFLKSGGVEDIAKHFVAVSTNDKLVREFGIDPKNMFVFWDWVGGRFSLSSAIGLSVMIGIGAEHFDSFLRGMEYMDNHFEEKPLSENMPVILALLGIWYGNFLGAESEAILPYDQHLQHLPAYLQQASMESNGKTVDRSGASIPYQTGSIIWGGAGTNSQHSFFQLLHQGSQLIPCDFIACINPAHEQEGHHEILLANCLAQSEALMVGRSVEQVEEELVSKGMDKATIEKLSPYKVFDGNRPSTTILLDALTPHSLGMLIALYEHKIFVQGVIWNVFSFDQFGVELGKVLANKLLPTLVGNESNEHDPSTTQLIKEYQSNKR